MSDGRKGLSPRVRGNPSNDGRTSCGPRSIPACAGEPSVAPALDGACGVYPRVCGGTRCLNIAMTVSAGLSPRVRGNQMRRHSDLFDARSIPACAGEPSAAATERRRPGVYPRVCGGTARVDRGKLGLEGLSPRVRGNHLHEVEPVASQGSIPACAGEPNGKHMYVYITTGLSPRVRGNRAGDAGGTVRHRSIPACAGEPMLTGGWSALLGVYPRVCGGTLPALYDVGRVRGLSPRVRGNPERGCC